MQHRKPDEIPMKVSMKRLNLPVLSRRERATVLSAASWSLYLLASTTMAQQIIPINPVPALPAAPTGLPIQPLAPSVSPQFQPPPQFQQSQAVGQAQPQTLIGTPRKGEPITLNFVNAEIEAVARTMATITGRNVVVDPRVKGLMTLTTERAVTPAVAYNQFLATLRLQGFTVVEAGGLDKVIPEADAKLQSATVTVGTAASSTGVGSTMTATLRRSGSRLAIAANVSSERKRGDFGYRMKPRQSAPHLSAHSASTSEVSPQTLSRMPSIIGRPRFRRRPCTCRRAARSESTGDPRAPFA